MAQVVGRSRYPSRLDVMNEGSCGKAQVVGRSRYPSRPDVKNEGNGNRGKSKEMPGYYS